MPSRNTQNSVLAGIKVLDLTLARAGPTASRQLGDWGAEVIRIELPGASAENDVIASKREGADFQNLHRNKKSLALDLKQPEGIALFCRLAQSADVIVENFRPHVKYKLGIDQRTMIKLNPRLIYASISGFGETGPYANRPGVDQIMQGLSGLMSITGEPGSGPMRTGIAIADTTAGLLCAQGIMMALFARERTGKGQWVRTSLLHSLLFMMDFQVARWLVDGEVPQKTGNNHPTAVPVGVFQTTDGLINIGAGGQRMWGRFCEIAGLHHMKTDVRFATPALRLANRDALNAAINEMIRTRSSEHWIEVLNASGVPAGPIYSINEVFEDAQIRHLDLCRELISEDGRTVRLVEQPVYLDQTPSQLHTTAPSSGQHSDEVLGTLGLSSDEIHHLRSRGVIS